MRCLKLKFRTAGNYSHYGNPCFNGLCCILTKINGEKTSREQWFPPYILDLHSCINHPRVLRLRPSKEDWNIAMSVIPADEMLCEFRESLAMLSLATTF